MVTESTNLENTEIEAVEETELEQPAAIGEIVIEDQVIIEYASAEVLKFDEVSRLVGGITESFSKNILGRESGAQGVKVSRDGNDITINIHIIVYYGVNIPQVSYDIQANVKEAVEAFTGLNVAAVNIGIEGIDRRQNNI